MLAALAAVAAAIFAMTLRVERDRVETAFGLLSHPWAEQQIAYDANIPAGFFGLAADCARFVPSDAWILFVSPPDRGEALYFRLAYMLYPRGVVPLDLGNFAFRNFSPYGRMRPEDAERASYVVFFGIEPRGSILAESEPVWENTASRYAIRRFRAKTGGTR